MIVKIVDYGDADNSKFIVYHVEGLSSNQIAFLDENLDEKTTVDGNLGADTACKKACEIYY